MNTKRAFTLIEVMVVLSILAIIAILAYNFFGGTMREATSKQKAVKIYNDMRVISDAAEMYQVDNGTLPTGNHNTVKASLIDGGYLKVWPTSPRGDDYYYFNIYDQMDGGSNDDDIIFTGNYVDAVCDEFMAMYANDLGTLKTAQWDYQGNTNKYPGEVLGKGARIYAIKWTTAAVDQCEIEWVMQYND